jgi:hypothetical protein
MRFPDRTAPDDDLRTLTDTLKCGSRSIRATGLGPQLQSRAYAKHAEVTVPLLDDWEKEWEKNSQRNAQPKLLPVDFRSLVTTIAQSN